ncbi:pitrilysin family protein [Aliiroseovarius subalbicans]|uniref:M16 family metallopeptidase n=1 Tax=Aliiroseovarius subalbicans TaxID=2925840 RepID=UPI001F5B00C0|nr:pitrilysin family protein [Aliiroseovarius subalbicans]MCI2399838.1 insulinase family protein [Aliiroseovarius subalbicans]
MTRFLSLLLPLLTFLSSPARAGEVTDFVLDNGLQVVVIEDHRAPVVVHMVWYRVGAADEPAGKSGIAHFFEHLMFKATDDLESGEFSRVVEANGGSDNAFTSQDYTAYFQRVAADRLGLMMQMEADRMRDLIVSEDQVITERNVILEERATRTDSEPGALFREQFNAAAHLNHPYGIPVIGWRHEIEALNQVDAQAFYETFYAPNNAILIVAGDVDPDEVQALATTHYGPLQPTPDLPVRARPSEPPQLAERRLVFKDARVGQPYVMRRYQAPERDSGDQAEAAALVYLADLLGGAGATSVLGRALQFDTTTAVYTGASYGATSLDDTGFTLVVVPAQGVSLEAAETEMDRVLSEFMEQGVDAAQFARLKMQIRASEIYALDDVGALADRYGRALTTGLTLEDVAAWPDILQAVTAEDVMAAAARLFDRRRAVTGWVSAGTEEAAQ